MLKRNLITLTAVCLACLPILGGSQTSQAPAEYYSVDKPEELVSDWRPLVGLTKVHEVEGDRITLDSGVKIELVAVGMVTSSGPFWTPDGKRILKSIPKFTFETYPPRNRLAIFRISGGDIDSLGIQVGSKGSKSILSYDQLLEKSEYNPEYFVASIPYSGKENQILLGIADPYQTILNEKLTVNMSWSDYDAIRIVDGVLTVRDKSTPRNQGFEVGQLFGDNVDEEFLAEFLDKNKNTVGFFQSYNGKYNRLIERFGEVKGIKIKKRVRRWFSFKNVCMLPGSEVFPRELSGPVTQVPYVKTDLAEMAFIGATLSEKVGTGSARVGTRTPEGELWKYYPGGNYSFWENKREFPRTDFYPYNVEIAVSESDSMKIRNAKFDIRVSQLDGTPISSDELMFGFKRTSFRWTTFLSKPIRPKPNVDRVKVEIVSVKHWRPFKQISANFEEIAGDRGSLILKIQDDQMLIYSPGYWSKERGYRTRIPLREFSRKGDRYRMLACYSDGTKVEVDEKNISEAAGLPTGFVLVKRAIKGLQEFPRSIEILTGDYELVKGYEQVLRG